MREDDEFSDLMQYLQEERFLLRHMEREEPQGEENGEPMLQCQMQQAVASAAARFVHMLSKTTRVRWKAYFCRLTQTPFNN